jgi:hypothetical protein
VKNSTDQGGDNLNKKHLAIEAVLALALLLSLLFNAAPYIHKNPSVTANVYLTENIGGVTSEISTGNLITDIGENFMGNASLGLENNATWAISLSNVGSPLAAWTQLDTEIAANNFTRAGGTGGALIWVNSGDYAFNVTYTFTATGTQQLQTAGLHWNSTPSSDLNLFAAATFTQTTFNSGDTLTIKWVITINAN